MKKSFRRSRIAMLIDVLLCPVILIHAAFMDGVPAAWDAAKHYPHWFAETWRNRGWFKGDPFT